MIFTNFTLFFVLDEAEPKLLWQVTEPTTVARSGVTLITKMTIQICPCCIIVCTVKGRTGISNTTGSFS